MIRVFDYNVKIVRKLADVSALCRFSGQGDFGMVTLGKLSQSRCSFVAIKAAKDEGSGDVLLGEAKIMAGLDHKNVIKILAFQKAPAKVVMEFVEGGNLRGAVEVRNF